MCAINGIAGEASGTDRPLVERMNAATAHRGPDGTRIFAGDGVILGFNRLAIIDLNERSMQPMRDASGRYTIIFNGEIYNYKELKKELSEYPFTTESDTEVILAGYSRWGDAAFSRMNGMFGIALWDEREKRLVLARDSAGVKPLYYAFAEGKLVFSSEIKALLEAGVPRTLDEEAFGHYLRLMYTPSPMTMFKEVRKLAAGHTLVFQNSTHSIEPFRGAWPAPAVPQTYEDAQERVRSEVEAAVTRQLVSDRPVGVYLSGGIDSSIVLASAVKTHPKIDTFSVGFELGEGEESEKFNADAELAQRTAKHFGATHHEFRLSSEEVLNLFSTTMRQLDEPIGNATALAQMFLARQAKPVSTVVLTGEGGDELFGGYERYRLALKAQMFASFVPKFVAKEMFGIENSHLSGVDRFAQLMFQKDAVLARVVVPSFALPDTRGVFENFFSSPARTVDDLMRADERSWLVEEALMRSDKTSMASAVETRVPFLDSEVRSLVHALPLSYKVTQSSTKRILKDAFKNVLPAELLRQPKRGWFSPGAKWLRRPDFVNYANVAFSREYAPGVRDLFNFPGIRAMWEAHREKREYHYTELFAVLAFLEWAREYKVTL